MEAGVYVSQVPIEHASLHMTVPRVERTTDNSSGCCWALYNMYPVRQVRDPARHAPSVSDGKEFCKTCAKSPNQDLVGIINASNQCAGPSSSLQQSHVLRARAPSHCLGLERDSEDMVGSE